MFSDLEKLPLVVMVEHYEVWVILGHAYGLFTGFHTLVYCWMIFFGKKLANFVLFQTPQKFIQQRKNEAISETNMQKNNCDVR